MGEIEIVVVADAAFWAGFASALSLSPEEAAAQRLLLRDGAVRSYACDRYAGQSQRGQARAVAADLLRHAAIREALGGVALSESQIRKILAGGRQ